MSVEAFSEAQQRRRPKAAAAEPGGRHEIQIVDAKFNAIVRQCAALLRERIYLRGVLPFAIIRAAEVAGGRALEDKDGEAVEIAGVRHRPGALVFTGADRERLAYWLDEAVLFYRWSTQAQNWLPTTCPAKLAQRLVSVASELGFRPCVGISRTPLFLEGEVITAPGWNAPTGMLLDLPDNLPRIPDTPTKDDAKRALSTLLQPFRGYTADNPALRPLFAAAVLTAALRASLPTAPAVVLDGNTIGAGKGKAARAIGVIATGGMPAVTPEGHTDEETDKRIAAAIMQGSSAILLDNLQRPLASTTLESILTDPVARIRKFGSLSDDLVTECRALVLITANNATLRRDLLRRSLPVRLAVPTDKPELRRFGFDPVVEARRDRPKILGAAFTIARAWWLARPAPENDQIRERTLGSFELWADLVAGAVEWLTGTNPITAIQDRKDNDTADAAERGLIRQLTEAFDDKSFSAADAAKRLSTEAWGAVLSFKGEAPTGRAVGNWLRLRRDRRFRFEIEGHPPVLKVLEMVDTDRKGIALWRVVSQNADSGTAPESPAKTPHSADVPYQAVPESGPLARAHGGDSGEVHFDTAWSGWYGTSDEPPGDETGDWEVEL